MSKEIPISIPKKEIAKIGEHVAVVTYPCKKCGNDLTLGFEPERQIIMAVCKNCKMIFNVGQFLQ